MSNHQRFYGFLGGLSYKDRTYYLLMSNYWQCLNGNHNQTTINSIADMFENDINQILITLPQVNIPPQLNTFRAINENIIKLDGKFNEKLGSWASSFSSSGDTSDNEDIKDDNKLNTVIKHDELETNDKQDDKISNKGEEIDNNSEINNNSEVNNNNKN